LFDYSIALMALACGAEYWPSAPKPPLLITYMATPQNSAATRVPTNFQPICLAGVEPIQWPILRSVLNAPLAAKAVQTTPPTIIVTNMPTPPVKPSFSITKPVMSSVSIVMPLMGLVPIVAMAQKR